MRAREERHLSLDDVAERMAERGPRAVGAEAVRLYEKMQRQPPIDVMASWARALDYRLIVDVVPAGDGAVPVMLRDPSAIEVARRMEAADEEGRRLLLDMARRLIPDSP